MTEFKIRQLEYSDLMNGFLEILDDFGSCSSLINSRDKRNRIYDEITRSRKVVFVAVLDDETVIGTASLLPNVAFVEEGATTGYVDDVVVGVNFRGMGIGTSLVNELIKYAKQHNYAGLFLTSNDTNMSFYGRFGFESKNNNMKLKLG